MGESSRLVEGQVASGRIDLRVGKVELKVWPVFGLSKFVNKYFFARIFIETLGDFYQIEKKHSLILLICKYFLKKILKYIQKLVYFV